MADKRAVFTPLEDDITGEGLALPARKIGDDSLAKNGLIAYGYRDSADKVTLPKLTVGGAVPVDTGGAGICKSATGKVTATGGDDDVTTIVLALAKTYNNVELSVSNSQQTAWSLVYIDNVGGSPTETILWQRLTGPGDYGVDINFDCVQFDTISGTGVQNLVLRCDQISAANSDMRAYLGVKEI